MELRDDVTWKGAHISEFQTSLNRYQYPRVIHGDEHAVIIRTPISAERVPECFPSIFNKRDYWDRNHVKLPCSEKNVTKEQINRWHVMRNAFSTPLSTSQQLEAAILSYNKRYAEQWTFSALHSFFEEALDEAETSIFFSSLLPKIVELALRLPELVTGGIPLLRCGRRYSVTLSQLQISCLLANAFLCAFPQRNSTKHFGYPDINFNNLFQCILPSLMKSVHEKLKCILNYFRRVTTSVPKGVVTYSRQFVPDNVCPKWSRSNEKLPRLYVSSSGTIEDNGFGLFQVDFANKFVGGGVLGMGCVQEEIRFVICPELILSRLFTQCLGDNEALVVIGCERFNKYTGYGSTFQWDGNYTDDTPFDEDGRRYCTVIALDALCFSGNDLEQYSPKNVLREMNKAYIGFSWGNRRKRDELCAVATGNWGCGAFRGDPQLKSLLQLMAAAEAGRDVAYFTFGDSQLRDSMAALHVLLSTKQVTVGNLYQLLGQYSAERTNAAEIELFDYIRNEINQCAVEYATGAIGKDRDSYPSPNRPNTRVATHTASVTASTTEKLGITQRAFCYRWKKPTTDDCDNDSPPEICPNRSSCGSRVAENDRRSDDCSRGEVRALLSSYRRLPDTQPHAGERESTPEAERLFDPLDRFKRSLQLKRRSGGAAEQTHSAPDSSDEALLCDVADRVDQCELRERLLSEELTLGEPASSAEPAEERPAEGSATPPNNCGRSTATGAEAWPAAATNPQEKWQEKCDADDGDNIEMENAAADDESLPYGGVTDASCDRGHAVVVKAAMLSARNSGLAANSTEERCTAKATPVDRQKRKITDFFGPRSKRSYNES